MATQPGPDIIEPAAPPETPATPIPHEAPNREPPEVAPPVPDTDVPGQTPPETPPLPE